MPSKREHMMLNTIKNITVIFALLLLSSCASTPAKKQTATLDDKMQASIDASIAANKEKFDIASVNAALLPPLKIDLPDSSRKQLEPRFDLVINDAPANQVLMGIVNGTRYSMLVHKDVSSQISLNLKNVTVFEALDTIRELYGYEYKVDGTRIFIEPQSIQTRVFQVNYIIGKRSGSSDTSVTSGSMAGGNNQNNNGAQNNNATQNNNGANGGGNSSQSVSSRISTQSETNFWEELKESLTSLVGSETGRKIVINAQSGLILVRAMPNEIRDVQAFLELMQLNIERQVILEAKILNVELNDSSQTGVNWAFFGNGSKYFSTGSFASPGANISGFGGEISSGSTSINNPDNSATIANLGGSMFALSLQGSNFATLLNFLDSQGNVKVLSSPRIATINNQKAVLKVGTDDFFVTNVQPGNQATTGNTTIPTAPTVTLQPFFSGIALDVTPQIDKDDNIILHIHPSISTVTEVTKDIDTGQGGTLRLPLASNSVSETDSIVRTKDGNVIAIGGLMNETITNNNAGVPGLKKLKGIGKLFSQEDKSSVKSELVVLLKATVVKGNHSWNEDMLSSKNRFRKLSSH